jgi:hypothetical protein
MGKVIDADFELVSGPLRAGDEHPVRKGWYLTDRLDRFGNQLWYKPPGPISRWIRRIGIILWGLLILGGIVATLASGGI